ncbi:MAG: nicotinamide-nucleotide amidase [Frankiales bacterium]|nr:nicotinamide-nucleotide amidase [Frankiales bacterium]
MRAEVLAVGTELLIGDVVNGNAATIGRLLTDAGVEVVRSTAVADDEPTIAEALHMALTRADAVLVTGGLGPTQDDLTREALALAAGVPLLRDESLADALLARYEGLGRRVPAMNLRQAELPEGATAIPNPKGTAPGVRMELNAGVVYALPGVPHEMHAMLVESVLPDLLSLADAPATIVSRTLHTAGMWESAVAEALSDLHERLASTPGAPTLAWLAGKGQTRVRVTARAATREAALGLISPVEAEIRSTLGIALWGVDDETLPGVIHGLLLARGQTVAAAESLTGGLLGAALTSTPGSSATFRGGVTAYSSELKTSLLGASLEEGAVSASTARAMAAGVRERLGSSFGLALTGVAGPEEQEGQPAGTVHVAVAGPSGGDARVLRLPGDRDRVRQLAVTSALDLLRRHLLGGQADR